MENNQSCNEASQNIESKYAQLVSSVVNQYDVTLIFYQGKPVQVNKGNITQYKSSTEEVARVTLSHKAFKELSSLLAKQINEIASEEGESKTIEKLKKQGKGKIKKAK